MMNGEGEGPRPDKSVDPGPKETESQGELFPGDSFSSGPAAEEPKIKRLVYPIWTENKAKLIERYLYYFVLITKHGTYIDGFAGPQKPGKPDLWAAKLVLESEPRWLRHFYLFDRRRAQVARLNHLKAEQPTTDAYGRLINREIRVEEGDFNVLVHDLLRSGRISGTEAAFCLLDQTTFQCHWSTVKALSDHKAEGEHKIELFYFLATGWMRRALCAVKTGKILENWWGRNDWAKVREMQPLEISQELVRRLKEELGYESVKAWPIYERQSGGRVMYHMIHATDHPHAPHLISRAYDRAVQAKESPEQCLFDFAEDLKEI
jgi:three-Cys-motif partner protein